VNLELPEDVIIAFGVPVTGLSREEIDGAVAELQHHPDGSVTAQVRIPARQDTA
jgi:hypothetical protein